MSAVQIIVRAAARGGRIITLVQRQGPAGTSIQFADDTTAKAGTERSMAMSPSSTHAAIVDALSRLDLLTPGFIAWFDALPTTDPATNGALWNNGGFVCISTSGAGSDPGSTGPSSTATLDSLLNGLPTTMPATSGVWWNNNGTFARTL